MRKSYAGIGSRLTPLYIRDQMTEIAKNLARQGWILRSGAASGADQAFENGAGDAKEIYIPWKGFNKSTSLLLPIPEAFSLAECFHPNWKACKQYDRALHARNCHQALGANLDDPVAFVICWTSGGGAVGGTGQAMRIAADKSIRIYNLFHKADRELWEKRVEDGKQATETA